MSPSYRLSPVTSTAPTLPLLPSFEDKWHSFPSSAFPSSPSYPPTPSSTPRTMSIQTSSASSSASTPRYLFPRRPVMPSAPPSSPRFEPVHSLNARNLNDVCTFAPLALSDSSRHSSDSDFHAALMPGLTDSFTCSSSSSSSDEHEFLPSPREDPYYASTTSLWDTYYTSSASPPRSSSPTHPLYHLPSAKSCYDLGFGGPLPLSSPIPPSPPAPLAPSPRLPQPTLRSHHKSTPSLRRPPSQTQKSGPRGVPDCFKDLPPPPPIDQYYAQQSWPPSRPAPVPPSPAFAHAPPPRTSLSPLSPMSPTFSLFPVCPPTRAARPVTAPCPERVVEKSVWEDDDDDDELSGFKNVAAKLHIRSISVGNGTKDGGVKGGSWGRKGGAKRTPSEVMRGLFGMK